MQLKSAVKISVITNIPAPYRFPVFKSLNDLSQFDFKFFFTAKNYSNRSWVKENDLEFQYRIFPGKTLHLGKLISQDHFYLDLNPTAPFELMANDSDIAIIGGYSSLTFLFAYIIFKIRRKKIILWGESNTSDKTSKIYRLLFPLIRFMYTHADACIASSTRTKELFLKFGVNSKSVFLSPLTIDNNHFHDNSFLTTEERKKARLSLGLKNDIVILFVGRLIDIKGIYLLIDAILEIKKINVSIDLLIVGDGPEKNKVESICKQLGINAVFPGFIDQKKLPGLYGVSDIFVLPSFYETFGLVLCEAMACNLPLLVSNNVGAVDDLVFDGENGYIFESGNTSDLRDKLSPLILDQDLRRKMGKRSWEIIKNWNLDRAVRGFTDAIKYITDNNSQ